VKSEEIDEEFRGGPKSYEKRAPIEGVKTLKLTRFTDDRGFFLEIFRTRPDHPESRALAEFFSGSPMPAQMNYSTVDIGGHIKGLHYHLKQDDIWFFPPPSKAKVVLFDLRKGSPTFRQTQVLVAGGGQDLLIRIPVGVAHGYRPLTSPCSLLYFVTETFDPASPDEYRVAWDHPAVRELWDVPNG
jgi:dTDP-4-dehydrorhamnose 3,5-epimerase